MHRSSFGNWLSAVHRNIAFHADRNFCQIRRTVLDNSQESNHAVPSRSSGSLTFSTGTVCHFLYLSRDNYPLRSFTAFHAGRTPGRGCGGCRRARGPSTEDYDSQANRSPPLRMTGLGKGGGWPILLFVLFVCYYERGCPVPSTSLRASIARFGLINPHSFLAR